MVLDFFAGHLLFCCFVKEIMKKRSKLSVSLCILKVQLRQYIEKSDITALL